MSGSSKTAIPELPTLLSYPDVPALEAVPELNDKFVYFVRGYPLQGLAVLVARKVEDVYIRIGNWDGQLINPMESEAATNFVKNYSPKLISLMSSAKIPQAIYYLSVNGADVKLVDVRLSLNKFTGPGMLRDLFSKVIETQEVLKIDKLTPEAMIAIKNNEGSYSGDLIIKPSAFKTMTRQINGQPVMYPMYGLVQRKPCPTKPH